MAIYKTKEKWMSDTKRGFGFSLRLELASVTLQVELIQPGNNVFRYVNLYEGKETNFQIRAIADVLVEHLGLSFAEKNSMARTIRKFVTS